MNLSISISSSRIHRIAVSVFFFIAGLTFASWASRIPDIKTQLHLSEAALGAVLLALPAGLLTSLPFSGWLVTRFGSRQMVIMGALAYPLSLVLLGLATSTVQLVGGLFLFGLLSNLTNIAMNTQAVGVESIYGKNIMASFHGMWSIAGFTGALVGSLIVSFGLSPFYHFSMISFVTAILVALCYRFALPADTGTGEKQPLFVKPDKKILQLGLIAFCCMLCEGAMADWSGVYFQKVVNTPKELTTLGYVAFAGMMAAGRFMADGLVTRFGAKSILQVSGTLIAFGLMIAVLFPFFSTAIFGFLLVGLGVSSVVPIVYGLAGRSDSMSPGLALAAVSSISFLGFLVGPPLIGFIAEASNLRWSFIVIGLVGLVTVLLAKKVK